MMDAYLIALVMAGGAALGVVVWLLAKLGKALIQIAEALAAAAVVLFAMWLVIKAVVWALRQTITHWRTSLTVLAVVAWWHCWGGTSLALTAGVTAGVLAGWRLISLASFDAWAGRHLRAWWLRWTVYAPKLPAWLHACGLSIKTDAAPAVVMVTPLRRSIRRSRSPVPAQLPQVLGVRSGASWDEVRVGLVPGQKPEDFDDAARALASARGVTRCQVRELTPNVVSIDFQRRNLLADPLACPDLTTLANVAGTAVDLRRVFSGRTEYGQDWHVPLAGGHTLVAGSTGAGKNSAMWCPLVSIAPAIRDGLVRVSGIDPKGMELAYGRRIFSRYAVTGTDALAVLDDLVEAMHARKTEFAGEVRSVPISPEHPLELLEFDEIGALTKYIDRKTREAITESRAVDHPRSSIGIHRPRLCPGTHQGDRPRPGAIPPPDLPAGLSQITREHGAGRSGLRARCLGQPDHRDGGRRRLRLRRRHPGTTARPRRVGARRNDQATRNIRHRPRHPQHGGSALPDQAHGPQRVDSRRRCMTTVAELLTALCAHLAGFELPATASVLGPGL
jgi:S-DNA-T family DNA segregation ATPase FtsK/SpoIIIE